MHPTSVPCRSIVRRVLALLTVIMLLGPEGGAQVPRAIRTGAASGQAQVSLNLVAELSDSLFSINDRHSAVFTDRSGRFLVVGEGGASIGIYSRKGEFERRVGRSGRNLGEFGQIGVIAIGPGDSVHVFDIELQRRTIYDPQLSSARRETPAPRVTFAAALPAGKMLVSGNIPTRESAGMPLHELNARGEIVRSFGSDNPSFKAGPEARLLARLISKANSGGFWIAPFPSYEFELLSPSLKGVHKFTREISWFPAAAASSFDRPPGLDKPPSYFRGIREDSTGLVWVNVAIAASSWKPPTEAQRQQLNKESSPPGQMDIDKLFDTMVELIDVKKGEVVVSQRFPGSYYEIPGTDLVWQATSNSRNGVSVRIYRWRRARR